jgi:bifunctional non-homologous end joining protein LigD
MGYDFGGPLVEAVPSACVTVKPVLVTLTHWVEPVLVVDVDYAAWTKDGRLRQPSYKGIRTDLDPQGVVRE